MPGGSRKDIVEKVTDNVGDKCVRLHEPQTMAISVCYLFLLYFVTTYLLQSCQYVDHPTVKLSSLKQVGWTKSRVRLTAPEQVPRLKCGGRAAHAQIS